MCVCASLYILYVGRDWLPTGWYRYLFAPSLLYMSYVMFISAPIQDGEVIL